MDQKLITRDIGLEYIAGYEQARFGGSRNDPLPVTVSPLHHRHHHQHNQNQQQQRPGTATMHNSPREMLEEEDYIRFMKVLSWILQELGWNQETEDAYEEECGEHS